MKIVRTQEVAEIGVSHNEEIKKKVLFEKGTIPRLMNFSFPVFKPGKSVESDSHPTICEDFFILKGRAEVVVNQEKVILGKGDFITIEQGEWHSQSDPYSENVAWVYFGTATDWCVIIPNLANVVIGLS